MMLTASTISGYVYQDTNGDGLYGAGDRPIAGSPIQLVNSAKMVVGSTTTDASGKYQFSSDGTVQGTPGAQTQTLSFPATPTNFTKSATISQFDPSLGTLTSVDVTFAGTLSSDIKVESRDANPMTVVGHAEGTLVTQAPGIADLMLRPTSTVTFPASAYDGQADFGGTSGKDFGAVTASDSKTVTLTTPGDLAAYTGTGTVPFSVGAASTSAAAGPGNLLSEISSTGEATVNVVYHYLPQSDLKPGRYSIVQTAQPNGFLQGSNSRGGVVLPRSAGVDTIPVTLADSDLTDNNFGELLPAAAAPPPPAAPLPSSSLSGSVYLDANNNGARDPNEFGIATVNVTLRGRDNSNRPVMLTSTTDAYGVYQFNNLRPGQYTITKSQPNAFRSGQETIGSQGGQASRNRFSRVVLRDNTQGVNYNFGEQARPNCSLASVLARVDRGLPLRSNLGPNLQRYLPGLVVYNTQHPRRR
ncbi:choice-of-anchor E domain-containing protein [Singulisphaera sp. GP187]|uniref:choice-of-anchor E domain-containing protein n=1 Tax=Singulisphaera sp. GP187 TaxID=1882752 RepID=UPI0009416C4F|nr:choice-of-anchor E domain-containing protein [Singulisphaera sp. GP187]